MNRFMKELAVTALCVSLAGCSAPAQNTQGSSVKTEENKPAVTDNRQETAVTDNRKKQASFTDADFETKEYMYTTRYGTSYYVIVKNNSEATVHVSGHGVAKSAEGEELASADMKINVIGPGEEVLGYFYFNDLETADHVDYEMKYEAENRYMPVVADLAMEQTLNDSNVTITVTNNGSYCAEFVEATALFLDADNNVIRTDTAYFTDDESEIKPGDAITKQLDCSEYYDRAEIYLDGRSTGKTVNADSKNTISESDFSVKEYVYDSRYGTTYYYLIVTNNGTQTAKVNVQGTAKDSGGSSVGAVSNSIDVLGPGETSILTLPFDRNTGEIAYVDYKYSYKKCDHYSPVINDLSVNETLNDKNVIVEVTNNGKKAAKFLMVEALFFDENNEIIQTDSTYAVDDDHEIKPGDTITKQLDCSKYYDHVELYFTGRAQ